MWAMRHRRPPPALRQRRSPSRPDRTASAGARREAKPPGYIRPGRLRLVVYEPEPARPRRSRPGSAHDAKAIQNRPPIPPPKPRHRLEPVGAGLELPAADAPAEVEAVGAG